MNPIRPTLYPWPLTTPAADATPTGRLSAACQRALATLENNLKACIRVDRLLQNARPEEREALLGDNAASISTQSEPSAQMGKLLETLHSKGDDEFYLFVDLLRRAHYNWWPCELERLVQKAGELTAPQPPEAAPVAMEGLQEPPLTADSETLTQLLQQLGEQRQQIDDSRRHITRLEAEAQENQRQVRQHLEAAQKLEQTIVQLELQLAAAKAARQPATFPTDSSLGAEHNVQHSLQQARTLLRQMAADPDTNFFKQINELLVCCRLHLRVDESLNRNIDKVIDHLVSRGITDDQNRPALYKSLKNSQKKIDALLAVFPHMLSHTQCHETKIWHATQCMHLLEAFCETGCHQAVERVVTKLGELLSGAPF
ncbi:MAG: hypothetical protein OXC07_04250 [Kistimonas sp.]|nr:hypothetical protein [Kistimonas sp.]